MLVGTCQAAQPLFGCRAARVPVSSPPPPHVGAGFRHTHIAGCGPANRRHRFCSVTRTSMRDLVRRAGSRTPARAIASGGEGRVARPRATDEQLVGGGQGVCVLPSRREGMWCGARCVAREGGRAESDRDARSVQGRARLRIGSRARGGAHVSIEHVVQVSDAGGVEAQRLVERPRVLQGVERRAYGAWRGVARVAGGGGRPRSTQRVGEGSTASLGQGAGRSAR